MREKSSQSLAASCRVLQIGQILNPLPACITRNGCGSNIGTQNGTLASGNMDQNLRSPWWFNFDPHPNHRRKNQRCGSPGQKKNILPHPTWFSLWHWELAVLSLQHMPVCHVAMTAPASARLQLVAASTPQKKDAAEDLFGFRGKGSVPDRARHIWDSCDASDRPRVRQLADVTWWGKNGGKRAERPTDGAEGKGTHKREEFRIQTNLAHMCRITPSSPKPRTRMDHTNGSLGSSWLTELTGTRFPAWSSPCHLRPRWPRWRTCARVKKQLQLSSQLPKRESKKAPVALSAATPGEAEG